METKESIIKGDLKSILFGIFRKTRIIFLTFRIECKLIEIHKNGVKIIKMDANRQIVKSVLEVLFYLSKILNNTESSPVEESFVVGVIIENFQIDFFLNI